MDLLGYGKSLTIRVELGSKRFVVIKGQDKLFAKVMTEFSENERGCLPPCVNRAKRRRNTLRKTFARMVVRLRATFVLTLARGAPLELFAK